MSDTGQLIKDFAPLATAAAALIVASFQYLITRKKTLLEIEKLKGEVAAIEATSKTTASNLSELQDAFVEQLPKFKDEIAIYENTSGSLGHDIRDRTGHRYNDRDEKIGEEAKADVTFENGTISVERKNKEGRVELHLVSYGPEKSDHIERDQSGDGARKLRVTCEVRSTVGTHTLRVVLRDPKTTKWFGSTAHTVSSSAWKRVESYFTLPPLAPGAIRLDLIEPSETPSMVQIRKLLVTQRVA
jgi:hypothetical protein